MLCASSPPPLPTLYDYYIVMVLLDAFTVAVAREHVLYTNARPRQNGLLSEIHHHHSVAAPCTAPVQADRVVRRPLYPFAGDRVCIFSLIGGAHNSHYLRCARWVRRCSQHDSTLWSRGTRWEPHRNRMRFSTPRTHSTQHHRYHSSHRCVPARPQSASACSGEITRHGWVPVSLCNMRTIDDASNGG